MTALTCDSSHILQPLQSLFAVLSSGIRVFSESQRLIVDSETCTFFKKIFVGYPIKNAPFAEVNWRHLKIEQQKVELIFPLKVSAVTLLLS